jgi:hypothetical protein
MARFSGNTEADAVEHVGGNGLPHRRALLRCGAMFAGALGVGAGTTLRAPRPVVIDVQFFVHAAGASYLLSRQP